jgi:signal transduction histidine kinase
MGMLRGRPFRLQSMQDSSQSKRLPLGWVLVLPFTLQIMGVAGLISWLSFKNSQNAVDDLAEQLSNEISDRIDQQLDSYLATPKEMNKINREMIDLKMLDLTDFKATGQYFWRQAQIYKVSYLQYGTTKGEFIGAGEYGDGDYKIEEIPYGKPGITYKFDTDEAGDRTQLLEASEYDPRVEPWYINSQKTLKPNWGDVYNWETNPEIMSVPAGYPLLNEKGEFVGALGVDINLAQVSQFLQTLKIGQSGKAFILERDGLMVGNSVGEKPYKVVNNVAERLPATESTDATIQQTAEQLSARFGNLSEIKAETLLSWEIGGHPHYVQISPWRDDWGLDWLVVLTIPEADFMAQIDASRRTTILLCLASVIGATAAGIATARWVTKPLFQLKQASVAIANGQLDQTIALQGTEEIATLGDAFNRMAQQLRESFSHLEKSKEELEERVESRTEQLHQSLSDLQKAQVELVQQEKLSTLGELVAGVAHEINNPMGCIANNIPFVDDYSTQLLAHISLYQQEHLNPGEAIAAHAEEIDLDYIRQDLPNLIESMVVSSDRIRAISDSLRTFARSDTHQKSEFNLNEGLDSTLLILKHRLQAQDHRSEVEIVKTYGELPHILCYPGQLNQVFMNLLANAIDAFDEHLIEHPVIDIRTEHRAQRVLIFIADNAGGMPEAVRSRIFEQAYTTKAVGKGTGLGLSIAQQIIAEKHSGQLSCVSTVGQGTEFIIELPI